MLFLVSAIASAAVEVVSDNNKIIVDANYHDFNNEDQEVITVTTDSFKLKNTGTENETVTVSINELPSSYDVTSKDVTIEAGAEVPVTLDMEIPHDADSGEQQIGYLTLDGVQTTTKVYQNTKSMLLLKEVKVKYVDVDDRSRTETFSEDDEDVELEYKVLPGTEVLMTFKYENYFNDNYDRSNGEIDDILLTVEVDDDQLYENNIDYEYDLDALEGEEKDTFDVTFVVAVDADTTDYNFDISLEGIDGQGAEHKVEKKLKLELERKDNDLRITEAVLTPAKIDTCTTSFTLSLEVQNFGTDDQKYVAVSLYNAELGINEDITDLKIDRFDDRDNTWNRLFNFAVNKELTAKTYLIDINVNYDRDEPIAHEPLSLVVEKCTTPVDTTTTNDNSGTTTNNNQQTTTNNNSNNQQGTTTDNNNGADQISSSAVYQTTENPYNMDDFIVGGLIVAMVLILAMIVVFFVILIK